MIAAYHLRVALSKRARPLLDDLSFEIPENTWVQFVAAGSQGKSVLFDLLSLRAAPKHGKLIIGGCNMNRHGQLKLAALRRRIGSCAQHDELLAARTVRENLLLPYIVRDKADEATKELEQVLAQLELEPLAELKVAALSPQERRLVQIARALVAGPEIILIDGGLDGLEDGHRRRVLNLLKERYRAGASIILFSRNAIPIMGMRVLELHLEDGHLSAIERTQLTRSPETGVARR